MDYEEYLASLGGEEDTASIEDAIAALNREEQQDPPADGEEEEQEQESQTSDNEEEEDPAASTETKTEEKPKQTPEENAKFAEQRRQKQIEERAQAELERLKKESPEFKMAERLSRMYGQPVEEILKQLEEAELAKQAEEMKVPVEFLKKQEADRQETAKLRAELNQLQFQAWEVRVNQEETQILAEYPILTAEDMLESKAYLLQRLGRDASLNEAVHALHGAKIIKSLKESTKNEALAELSGRKKGALPPQGGKASESVQLTADELYVAKKMGMTPEEYHKYKT